MAYHPILRPSPTTAYLRRLLGYVDDVSAYLATRNDMSLSGRAVKNLRTATTAAGLIHGKKNHPFVPQGSKDIQRNRDHDSLSDRGWLSHLLFLRPNLELLWLPLWL